MRNEEPRDESSGRRRGEGHKRKEGRHSHGAKTFRRGRALAFLEKLQLKRTVLKTQLETPELQSIHPVLVGELKAVEMIMAEFVELFELHEPGENENRNEEPATKNGETAVENIDGKGEEA